MYTPHVSGVNSCGTPYTVHFYQHNGGLMGEVSPPHSLPRDELAKVMADWGNAHSRLFDQLPDFNTSRIQNTIDAAMGEIRKDISTITGGLRQRQQDADNLTQFLGVGLRGVLPYAIESVVQRAYRAELAEDPELIASAERAKKDIQRAEAALSALRASPLGIEAYNDSDLDEEFQIHFEE